MKGVFVHARGLCESDDVGEGTRVWAFAHVMAGARIGRRCNIGGSSFIEGGARIGDDCVIKNGVQVWDGVSLGDAVFVGPNATFTNDRHPRANRGQPFVLEKTLVEDGATIGANATIVCGVAIGAHAFVAAGAVVTRDVPAHGLVLGSPAQRVGWACHCGARLAEDLACSCGRRYRRGDDGQGLVPAS